MEQPQRSSAQDAGVAADGSPEQANLSDFLWESVKDLLDQARKTTFISKVKTGDLDPNFYGEFTMQDAAWCGEVAKLWKQLANNQSASEELRTYAEMSHGKYQKCSTDLFAAWHITDDGKDNVKMLDVATNYVNTIRDAMTKDPRNMMIATFACAKLWSTLIAELSTQTSCSNLYKNWVENNKDDSQYAIEHAAKIDEWDQKRPYDRPEALTLLEKAMEGEITMFNLKAT